MRREWDWYGNTLMTAAVDPRDRLFILEASTMPHPGPRSEIAAAPLLLDAIEAMESRPGHFGGCTHPDTPCPPACLLAQRAVSHIKFLRKKEDASCESNP